MNWQDFERSVFGKASTAESGPPAASSPAQAPSPFQKSLNWIKQALGMQAGSPPQVLDTNVIVSATDVLQDGWPFAAYEGTHITQTGPLVAVPVTILTPPDVTSQLVLTQLTIINNSAAGGTTFTVFGRLVVPPGASSGLTPKPLPPQPAASTATVSLLVFPLLFQVVIAPGATATTIDILGARQIVIPPGFALAVAIGPGGMVAGDVMDMHTGWARRPAGFRP